MEITDVVVTLSHVTGDAEPHVTGGTEPYVTGGTEPYVTGGTEPHVTGGTDGTKTRGTIDLLSTGESTRSFFAATGDGGGDISVIVLVDGIRKRSGADDGDGSNGED